MKRKEWEWSRTKSVGPPKNTPIKLQRHKVDGRRLEETKANLIIIGWRGQTSTTTKVYKTSGQEQILKSQETMFCQGTTSRLSCQLVINDKTYRDRLLVGRTLSFRMHWLSSLTSSTCTMNEHRLQGVKEFNRWNKSKKDGAVSAHSTRAKSTSNSSVRKQRIWSLRSIWERWFKSVKRTFSSLLKKRESVTHLHGQTLKEHAAASKKTGSPSSTLSTQNTRGSTTESSNVYRSVMQIVATGPKPMNNVQTRTNKAKHSKSRN